MNSFFGGPEKGRWVRFGTLGGAAMFGCSWMVQPRVQLPADVTDRQVPAIRTCRRRPFGGDSVEASRTQIDATVVEHLHHRLLSIRRWRRWSLWSWLRASSDSCVQLQCVQVSKNTHTLFVLFFLFLVDEYHHLSAELN